MGEPVSRKPNVDLTQPMCVDLAEYALKHVKGAGAEDISELADALAEMIEGRIQAILESDDDD